MAAKAWSFGRTAEVVGFARDAARERDERVLIHVLVDPDCPRELALSVRSALMPERAGGEVRVLSLRDGAAPLEGVDAAVVLPAAGIRPMAAEEYARAGVPVALVVEGALEAPVLDLDDASAPLVSVVAASSGDALSDKLAAWLSATVDKSVALAANFPFCRRAVTSRLIARCALQNAAVGAIHLIPGSDLPVMTANQLKLALDIAAAYGRPLEPQRVVELAGVVGAGLGWRHLARTLLGTIPGLGTILRAGIAYGGTLATGSALRARFDPPFVSQASASAGHASEAHAPTLLAKPKNGDEGYVTIGGERA